MKLNAPTKLLFWISVALFVIGVIASLVTIPFLSGIAWVILAVAFVVLALGNILSGA